MPGSLAGQPPLANCGGWGAPKRQAVPDSTESEKAIPDPWTNVNETRGVLSAPALAVSALSLPEDKGATPPSKAAAAAFAAHADSGSDLLRRVAQSVIKWRQRFHKGPEDAVHALQGPVLRRDAVPFARAENTEALFL